MEKKPKEWGIESTTTFVVESANLTPKHEIDFFRNVEMPKDVPVYVLKGGEIAETRINGVIEGDGNQKH